jgi:DNA-binding beta-propeller fold protein YncE
MPKIIEMKRLTSVAPHRRDQSVVSEEPHNKLNDGHNKAVPAWGRSLLFWIVGACFAVLVLTILARLAVQFLMPEPAPRLTLVQDIPLPGAFPDKDRTSQHPFAPGLASLYDHFDFQALDPQTGLLFIAHTGPAPDKEQQINPHFNPDTDAKNDGNIIVFDTRHNKVVGLLNIPQVAGIVLAPDLQKVFAADSNDALIYAIDERTLKYTAIALQANDSPDGITYDQLDHLVFVSDPGTPPTADSNVIERKNQNEAVINALTDRLVTEIPLGIDGQWGDDVGHVKFDPGLHRIFVNVQQLADPNSPNPNLLPPPGTAWLVSINPLTLRVVTRLKLPNSCITPHGMDIDTQQHIAFIACVDADPTSMIRVDLKAMKVFAEKPWPIDIKPDIVVIDSSSHLVFVGSGVGISLFQEEGRNLKWLGDYNYGLSMHTIAINAQTHEIYLPLPRVGGRPVLRIMHYTP